MGAKNFFNQTKTKKAKKSMFDWLQAAPRRVLALLPLPQWRCWALGFICSTWSVSSRVRCASAAVRSGGDRIDRGSCQPVLAARATVVRHVAADRVGGLWRLCGGAAELAAMEPARSGELWSRFLWNDRDLSAQACNPHDLKGGGDCSKIDWTFLGLSLANWSFLTFAAIALSMLVFWMARRRRA